MAKLTFTSENKAKTFERFPKLRLEKDEVARILAFEVPEVAFVHNLRSPKIENSKPVYKKNDKGASELDFTFLSNPLCLGDPEVIRERGGDVKNCPVCAMAKVNPDMVSNPQRKMAMHVFQYKTNKGKTPVDPFSGSVVVWVFSDKVLNQLIEINDEWDGNLAEVDLILDCKSAMFQQHDINASPTAFWKKNDKNKQVVKETIEAQKCQDLEAVIGRRMKADFIQDDLDRIMRDWKFVHRFEGSDDALSDLGVKVEAPTLTAGMNQLLEDYEPGEAKPAKKAATPKQETKTVESSTPVARETGDFSSVLDDLDL